MCQKPFVFIKCYNKKSKNSIMYTEISDKIYHIGFDDRTTDLFEALWPIPEGISYNAYLITDEVNILIDTVGEEYLDRFIEQVEKILAGKKIDYLIINHIEPDHSGSLKDIADKYPDMKIIGNKRTIDMVNNFYGITKNVQEIIDLQEMKTGQYNLRFYLTPMLHWPETMMCYETKTKTMFSGDVFG